MNQDRRDFLVIVGSGAIVIIMAAVVFGLLVLIVGP